MKKVIFLLILASCGRIPQDQIVSDPQNLSKLSEIQTQINDSVPLEAEKDEEYQKCIDSVKKAKQLNKKNVLSYNDYKELGNIFTDYEPKPLNCKPYISKNGFIDKFDSYCNEKYNTESTFTTIAAFPFRLTNVLLSIGTLGMFPYIHGPAYVNYKDCKNMSENLSIDYTNLPTHAFSEQEANQLKEKFKAYCENNYFYVEKRLCRGDPINPTKGCLKNFNLFYVSSYGVRDSGIIVERKYPAYDTQQYFLYEKSDYFDGQEVKNTENYYEYVGVYNDGIQKLPAFKITNIKKTSINANCEVLNR